MAMAGSQAQALTITPSPCVNGTDDSIKCWEGTDTNVDGINGLISKMFPVNELYRASADGGEFMSLADSYSTVFTPIGDSNPTGAVITLDDGGKSIPCPSCYLLVKDEDLAWYLFDISDFWDGTEAISLSGFWPLVDGGAGPIYYVSLFGGPPGTVLAPGPLGIMSIGLLLISVMRRLKES